MLSISVKEFLFWKKTQLTKGGDHESLALLLDSVGGISTSNLNSLNINPEENKPIDKHQQPTQQQLPLQELLIQHPELNDFFGSC